MKGKFLTLGLAGMAIVSCSNHDFDLERYAAEKHEVKIRQYTQAFINTFGEPAAGHTWGFGVATRGASAGDGYIGNSTWEKFNADELVNITDAERDAVLAAIAAKVTGSRISEEIVFPWENYYLQDVISAQSEYGGAGKSGNPSASYTFEAFDKGNACAHKNWPGYDYDNYAEVTNSAHINSYFQKQNADGSQTRINETALMTGMQVGTYEEMKEKQFRWFINCHENLHWSEYITVQVNGSWYICFDFACGHKENDVDGNPGRGNTQNDWDYNDWIIKITEAVPHGGENTPVWGEEPGDDDDDDQTNDGLFQIWCEDLGAEYGVNSNDFDFNDVVISFKKDASGERTEMWLDAAGATLPIEIYWDGTLLGEVHDLFGVNEKTMVNTGAGANVESKRLGAPLVGIVSPEEAYDKLTIQVKEGETGVYYILKNGSATAPQMIVCEYGLPWSREYIRIDTTYPSFVKWVGDTSTVGAKFANKK